MTRLEIQAQAALLLREGLGTVGAGDPFALDGLTDAVADDVARRTDCFWSGVTTDLTQGQDVYCDSSLYKVKGVFVTDAAGCVRPLVTTTETHLDRHFGAGYWRNAPPSDPPTCAAFQGVRNVRLYPTPSVTRAAGLMLEGYMTPRGKWAAGADECPLPALAHQAVVYGLCRLRALQFAGEVAGAMEKAQGWSSEYRRELGDIERLAATYAPRESLFLAGYRLRGVVAL